jgi:hypothetical protein
MTTAFELLQSARSAHAGGNRPEAEWLLRQAVELAPHDAEILSQLGVVIAEVALVPMDDDLEAMTMDAKCAFAKGDVVRLRRDGVMDQKVLDVKFEDGEEWVLCQSYPDTGPVPPQRIPAQMLRKVNDGFVYATAILPRW